MDKKIDSRLLGLSQANRGRKNSASRQRKSLAQYQKFRETLGNKSYGTYSGTGNYIEDTIILDIGARYSKVGFVGEPAPRRICKTYLRYGDERKSQPFSTQKFKPCVVLRPAALSISKIPQSPQTWQEIAELLLNDLLFTQLVIKPDKRRLIILQDPWWPTSFQNALARAAYRHGCPGIHFIDSLHTALYVTGQRVGIVLDCGYHTTKIQASMHGHILPETRGWRAVGFYKIMQEFKLLMRELAKLDFEKFAVDEQQIEKAIARTCFVQPLKYSLKYKKRYNKKEENENENENEEDTKKDNKNNDKDDLNPNSISYEFNVKKQSAFCKITPTIRRRICEVLFDEINGYNIVHFLCDQLLLAPIDCRGRLVNNILITGGTAHLPGFKARFIEEWHETLKLDKYSELSGLSHRFRLIKNRFPENIRMFTGASIYGELTKRFVEALFVKKKEFYKERNQRIDDWTEQSILDNSNIIKKLTHAEMVRDPQYRGRATYSQKKRKSLGVNSGISKDKKIKTRFTKKDNKNDNEDQKTNEPAQLGTTPSRLSHSSGSLQNAPRNSRNVRFVIPDKKDKD